MDILAGYRSIEEGTPKGKAGAEQTVLRVQRSKFLESEEKKKSCVQSQDQKAMSTLKRSRKPSMSLEYSTVDLQDTRFP